MLQKKQSRNSYLVNIIVFFTLILASVVIIYFRQYIVDLITVLRFTPTSGVASLSNRIDFSDYGQFLFYSSQPKLNDASEFNDSCKKIEKTTSILGCYSNYRIYIYDIDDSRLDGIREVTAAHEMLHAAYDRLDESEKSRLEPLLEIEYQKLLKNEEFADLMAFYERTEPGEKYNELHSLIGTIDKDISPELEVYYSKYFDDRSRIVDYYDAYNSAFKVLSDRASVLSKKLESLSSDITVDSDNYNKMVSELNSDIAFFNNKAESGDFSSWTQFYSERSILETRVHNLSVMREKINSNVVEYNRILEDYNKVAIESKNLYEVMNSTLVELNQYN